MKGKVTQITNDELFKLGDQKYFQRLKNTLKRYIILSFLRWSM